MHMQHYSYYDFNYINIFPISCYDHSAYLSILPWIFPGSPIENKLGNVQGNLTAQRSDINHVYDSHREGGHTQMQQEAMVAAMLSLDAAHGMDILWRGC